jgi:hypothetical protein
MGTFVVLLVLLLYAACSSSTYSCPSDRRVEIPDKLKEHCDALWNKIRGNLSSRCAMQKTPVKDCCDVMVLGRRNGIYWYREVGGNSRIQCDMENGGGGWTVFAKRVNATTVTPERYDKTWNKFKNGFGLLTRNFWLGLDNLHRLTTEGGYGAQLRLDFNGGQYWVEYDNFAVGSEKTNYTLHISGYKGGDGGITFDAFSSHNGAVFITSDHHSGKLVVKCSESRILRNYYDGYEFPYVGWWYLRSPFGGPESAVVFCWQFGPFDYKKVTWRTNMKEILGLTSVEMKLRVKRKPCQFD